MNWLRVALSLAAIAFVAVSIAGLWKFERFLDLLECGYEVGYSHPPEFRACIERLS